MTQTHATNTVDRQAQLTRLLRMAMWSGAACLLLAPWIAMRLNTGMQWTGLDFAIFGAMLLSACGIVELGLRVGGGLAYRLGLCLAVGAGFFLVWANLAVGIVGSEDAPINLLFYAVLAVAALGASIVRLAAAGMLRVMLATAAAQLLIAGYAAGVGETDGMVLPVFTAIYTLLWLSAAGLFHLAARRDAAVSR